MDVEDVAQLTGPGSINATDVRWNVYGTDLGHPVVHRGNLYLVFGDTWGADGVEGRQWRSNVMARVADPDPRHGLEFADMLTDERGWARELLSSRKIRGIEKTVIPTAGISDGRRLVLHYMSVRSWDGPGRWTVRHSGFAHSDDDGRTWRKDRRARWRGGRRFGQVAFAHDDGRPRFMFGIPAGRHGSAVLARLPGGDPLRLDRYEYWDGHRWQDDEASAAPVVPAPVGELSVRWSPYHDRWLMLYLHEGRRAVVLREARAVTGPWEGPRVVATADRFPQLYAPYLLPDTGTGTDVFFTMSRFDVYNVFLMRMQLPR